MSASSEVPLWGRWPGFRGEERESGSSAKKSTERKLLSDGSQRAENGEREGERRRDGAVKGEGGRERAVKGEREKERERESSERRERASSFQQGTNTVLPPVLSSPQTTSD